MLKNLVAEMARSNVSRQDIADIIDVSYNTIGCKIRGENDFYYRECVKIRDSFFPGMDLEYLFENDSNPEIVPKGA